MFISGKSFTDRCSMKVLFDNREAQITETESNFITCIAPVREDIKEDTTVAVTVSNVHPTEGELQCPKLLHYTYRVVKENINNKKRKIDSTIEDTIISNSNNNNTSILSDSVLDSISMQSNSITIPSVPTIQVLL
jgi:hypothetical protein